MARVKVLLRNRQVHQGKHKGQFHLIAKQGAIKAAAAATGRTPSSVSALISRRKKAKGLAGYHATPGSLPSKKTYRIYDKQVKQPKAARAPSATLARFEANKAASRAKAAASGKTKSRLDYSKEHAARQAAAHSKKKAYQSKLRKAARAPRKPSAASILASMKG